MCKIFIGIPSYNEEDLEQTIDTAFSKAEFPDNIYIGVAMQYTNDDFPKLDKYKNLNYKKINNPVGLGTGPTRSIAASFYNNEEYYLQIDGHTIFKKNWDTTLIKNYNELKKHYEKPIITTYVPYWYKDKNTGINMTMSNSLDFESEEKMWGLIPKSDAKDYFKDNYENILYNVEAVNSPFIKEVDFSNTKYLEHFLCSGHFLFTSGDFLQEVPFDPLIFYHEENTTALRAWTRGYRMFTIKDHVLWTREMFRGRDVKNSWRSSIKNVKQNEESFMDKIIKGSLRNKDILTGKILGEWGAVNKELLIEYEVASGIKYNDFYDTMYKEVEKNKNYYFAAKSLYNLDMERK